MTPARMPPLKDVAATLRKTTEYLAREVVRSSESPPSWTPFEWAIARCAAAIQGISTLLANNLRWRGDSAWQEFLAEQRTQSVLRDERIGELLRRVDAATQSARIACVGLKGAALRALGLYRPGERPMGDVDLLVSRDDLAGIAVVMRDLGYAEVFTTRRHVCTNRRTSSRHTVSASTSTTRSGSRCTRWWLSRSRSAWWISPRSSARRTSGPA